MRKIIFLCITLALLISSCTEDINKNFDVNPNSSLYDLPKNEALNIAKTFHKSVTSNPKTRTEDATFNIASTYRLNISEKTRALSDDKTPLIYEIEMNVGENKGKIIVSGDKRWPEVLAYIPSFNDSLYKVSQGPNVMIQMAKNALLNKIESYKDISSTRSHPVNAIPGEVSVMIVPFCTTDWHEGAPHNQLLPEGWIQPVEIYGNRLGNAWYSKYYTGKAVISIAQAMAYLQPNLNINGTYIDWEALTAEKRVPEPYNNMAAILSKYIYDTIGTYPVWGKAYNGRWPETSATIIDAVVAMETPIKNISTVLNSSQCGLICDKDRNWNLDVVKKSLLSLRPVLAGDLNRLAFLVDGYAIDENDHLYLHCNFSEGGGFNGYYMADEKGNVVFEPGGYFYRDTSLGIIANIRNR